MSTFPEKRPVCAGQSHCLRCQLSQSRVSCDSAYLLLGPSNHDAHQALVKALESAEIPYHNLQMVLAIPVPRLRISEVPPLFFHQLSTATTQDVKAAFFAGDLTHAAAMLAAFVRAEPLAALIERSPYEWVRDALEEDWLCNLFQPIVEADGSGVFAYEALIRARHPQTQEAIGAAPLIDACVKLNLEHVLDQRARRTAIRSFAALRQTPGLPARRLFINFMPNTIYDPEICLRTTMAAADEYGVPITDIVFEVVETEHIPDLRRLHTILDYYRARGAGTAVDDMGAGFSRLDYLTALRPDFVKLDRDLVIRAAHHISARQTMDWIIAQAKHLGIRVIAEGIETEKQRQVCLDAGADLMQGFLFARPANPPESLAFLPENVPYALSHAA